MDPEVELERRGFVRVHSADSRDPGGRVVGGVAPEPAAPADDTSGYRPPIGCVSGRRVSVPADEYLSGDVGTKLAVARAAGSDRNAKALETVLPETLATDGLSVGLGAVWVPSEVYRDWLRSLLPGLDWGLNIERTVSGASLAQTLR